MAALAGIAALTPFVTSTSAAHAVTPTGNLLTNGSFTSGTTGWAAYKKVTVSGGKACLSLASGDTAWSSALSQQGIHLTAGHNYALSFDVSSSAPIGAKMLRASVSDGVDDGYYQQMSGRFYGAGTTSAHQSFTFTAGHTYSNAKVIPVELAATATAAASVCLSNVALVDTSTTSTLLAPSPTTSTSNLFGAADFSAGLSGWTSYGSDQGSTANGVWTKTIKQGDGGWSTELFQQRSLISGHTYQVSYDVWSDAGNLTLRGGVHQDGDDGNNQWANWQVPITPTRTRITQTLTMPASDPHAHVILLLLDHTATTTNTVHIANPVLLDTSPTGATTVYTTTKNPVGHTTNVQVNQLGYLPTATKQATIYTSATTAQTWQLKNSAGTVVAKGTTVPKGMDSTTGRNVQVADFSSYTTAGNGYVLTVGSDSSFAFNIQTALYGGLASDAMAWFYTQRSATAIDGTVIGDAAYSRAAAYTRDATAQCLPTTDSYQSVYSSNGGTFTCTSGYTHNVAGGWFDAADTGEYVATGSVATWELLNSAEHNPTTLTTSLRIPEHGKSTLPDVLTEAKWELDWMLKMQVPTGQAHAGMEYAKVGDISWPTPGVDPSTDTRARYIYRPSTESTYQFAAVAAQAARVFKKYDATYAAKLLAASRTAYAAAVANPSLHAPTQDTGGSGSYGDSDATDDAYWAAAELFLTTGEQSFATTVTANAWNLKTSMNTWSPLFAYNNTANMGKLDLATLANTLPSRSSLRTQLTTFADQSVAAAKASPWGLAGPTIFWWGSTRAQMPQAIGLGLAAQMTSNQTYRNTALQTLDWVLGRNGVGTSFLANYGSQYARNGASVAYSHFDNPASPYVPVATLSAGPDNTAPTSDNDAVLKGSSCTQQTCWVDNPHSFATTENTVDGQAMVEWLAQYAGK